MELRTSAALLLAAFCFTTASVALANDSSFGGSGADLTPLKETRIQMASEDIVLELVPDRAGEGGRPALAWRVQARYEFHNPTDETVSLQMGFPESRCSEGFECEGRGGEFRGLQTTVRGRRVAQRTGSVPPRSEWGENVGRVYLYDVVFKPKETVSVEHRYLYDRSGHVTGEFVYYLTKTGTLWNGPIGHAKFTVRTTARPWFVVAPPGYNAVKYVEEPRGQRAVTELVFEMRQFTPRHDLHLYLASVWESGLLSFDLRDDCPSLRDAPGPEDFESRDRETLARCAALPLAQHGAPLPPELAAFFYGPRELSQEERLYAASFTDGVEGKVLRTQPNPSYAPSLLTPEDQAYIRSAEQALAKLGPDPAGKTDGAAAPPPSGPSAQRVPAATGSAAPVPASTQPSSAPASSKHDGGASSLPRTSSRGCGGCRVTASSSARGGALGFALGLAAVGRWRRLRRRAAR